MPGPRLGGARRLQPRLLQRHPAALLRARARRRRGPVHRAGGRPAGGVPGAHRRGDVGDRTAGALRRLAGRPIPALLRRQRAGPRAGRGGGGRRDDEAGRSPSLGRRDVRAGADPGAGRDDQLGPVRRRAARAGHAGLGAGETGGRRGAGGAGGGDQVLPAVLPRAAARAVPAGRPDARVLGDAGRGGLRLGRGERAGDGGRLRRLVEVLPALRGAHGRLQLDLVRAVAARPRGAGRRAERARRRAVRGGLPGRRRCWRWWPSDDRGCRSWCSSWWRRSC